MKTKIIALVALLALCSNVLAQGNLTQPSAGDITSVGVTAPITGGGTSGAVTVGINTGAGLTTSGGALIVDTAVIQSRVTGTCTSPNAIASIAANGTVTCTTGVSTLTNSAGNNVIPKSNGTNFVASSWTDNGSLTSTGIDVTVGDAAADVFDANGDLSKFGNTSGDGAIYIYNNTLNAGYAQATNFELAVNYLSNNAGTGNFRDFTVYDGKGVQACKITGSTKTLNCVGGLQVNGTSVVTTSNISGTANYIPKFTAASTIGNSSILDDGTNVYYNDRDQYLALDSSTGTRIVNIGRDTAATTNGRNGYRVTAYSDGNLYLDHKTFSGGSIVFRSGGGATTGAANTWMTVATTGPAITFNAAATAASTLAVNGNTQLGDTVADTTLIFGTTTVLGDATNQRQLEMRNSANTAAYGFQHNGPHGGASSHVYRYMTGGVNVWEATTGGALYVINALQADSTLTVNGNTQLGDTVADNTIIWGYARTQYDATHYLDISPKSNHDVSLLTSGGSVYFGSYTATNSLIVGTLGNIAINSTAANSFTGTSTANTMNTVYQGTAQAASRYAGFFNNTGTFTTGVGAAGYFTSTATRSSGTNGVVSAAVYATASGGTCPSGGGGCAGEDYSFSVYGAAGVMFNIEKIRSNTSFVLGNSTTNITLSKDWGAVSGDYALATAGANTDIVFGINGVEYLRIDGDDSYVKNAANYQGDGNHIIGDSYTRSHAIKGFTSIADGSPTAVAAAAGTVLSLDQADGTANYLSIRGATSTAKGILFANGNAADDGKIIYDQLSRGMTFGTTGVYRMSLNSSGTLTVGDSANTAINNGVDVVVLAKTGTDGYGITGLASLRATDTGTIQTNSGSNFVGQDNTRYVGDLYANATEVCTDPDPGMEGVTCGVSTNVALRLRAASADANYALKVESGLVDIDTAVTFDGTTTFNNTAEFNSTAQFDAATTFNAAAAFNVGVTIGDTTSDTHTINGTTTLNAPASGSGLVVSNNNTDIASTIWLVNPSTNNNASAGSLKFGPSTSSSWAAIEGISLAAYPATTDGGLIFKTRDGGTTAEKMRLSDAGTLTISGGASPSLVVDGDTTLGNAATDDITFSNGPSGINKYSGTHYEWTDDYLFNVAANLTSGSWAGLPIAGVYALSGIGGGVIGPGAYASGRFGIMQMSTGATATGALTILGNRTLANFDDGDWSHELTVMFDNLSTGTERYAFQHGFIDSDSVVDQTDGCYFAYDEGDVMANPSTGDTGGISGNNWSIWCARGGVRTGYKLDGTASENSFTTVSSPVVAGTWYRLRVLMDNSSLARFFINGTEVGNITTNIPTGSGQVTGAGYHLIKSVGTTARTANIDHSTLAFDKYSAR